MRCYVIIAFFLFLTSCNDNKAEKITIAAPLQPKYFFYPKANVYFDTVNKNYLFLGNEGSWVTEKVIPAAMQEMMDKSVLLDTFLQPVWKDNENHKLVYSAALYASPEDTVEKKPVSVIQKQANPDTTVKKERKGVRKFLDKIFSRKKKEKQTD